MTSSQGVDYFDERALAAVEAIHGLAALDPSYDRIADKLAFLARVREEKPSSYGVQCFMALTTIAEWSPDSDHLRPGMYYPIACAQAALDAMRRIYADMGYAETLEAEHALVQAEFDRVMAIGKHRREGAK